MTTTPSAVPALPPDAALLEATRRAERLAEHGPTVHGPSATGLLVVVAALMALAVPVVVFGERCWIGPVTVAAVGMVLAVRNWFVARRRHTLQPFRIRTDERPFAVLDRGQRQRAWRQITGRAPVSAASVSLVRAFLGWQRRSSRGAVPSLVAFGVVLLGTSWGLALSSGDVRLLVLVPAVAVFVTLMNVIEVRRGERVLRSLPDPSPSLDPVTGPRVDPR